MKNELEERTLEFALKSIAFVGQLPKDIVGNVLGRQMLKSATAIGALYREAQRAESKADFIHKVAIAEKEAAETEYWLLLFVKAGINSKEAEVLLNEVRELLAILVTIGRKTKKTLL